MFLDTVYVYVCLCVLLCSYSCEVKFQQEHGVARLWEFILISVW